MLIEVGYDILLELAAPTAFILMLYTHPDVAGRLVQPDVIETEPDLDVENYTDTFGNRCGRLFAPAGRLRLRSGLTLTVPDVPEIFNPDAEQHPVEELPSETLPFLLGSRYCEVQEMLPVAWDLFGKSEPGARRVIAICDWIHRHVRYDSLAARPTKTACDVWVDRAGVCRDFAHLGVTFCRCMNIPARYATGYLGEFGVPPQPPMDFAAYFEAYLGGRWYPFDARFNQPMIGRVPMARGRDAVDVALTTSFGHATMKYFKVWTHEAK